MSASSKKKLRKEQNAAILSEKQQREQAEAKKLKVNTAIFVSIIGLVLCAFVVMIAVNLITSNGVFEKATAAATFDGEEINSVEMNYYYVDAVYNLYSQWQESYGEYTSSMLSMMGLDTTKPLNEQTYNEETGETWADYVMSIAMNDAQHDFAVAKAAKEAGYTLSEEDQTTLDNMTNNMSTYAMIYGFSSTNSYLRNSYGNGADEDSYREYVERGLIADGYYNEYVDSLTYDDAAIREHDSENPLNYNSYDYSYYYVSYSDYLEGGTENDSGEIEYTEDENNAARAKAKEVADQLALSESLEAFDAAVKALEVDGETAEQITASHNTLYTKVSNLYNQWIADESRQAGDITVVANQSEAQEGEEEGVINGYYVVCFESATDNAVNMSNVRHLLVAFDTGDEENAEITDDIREAALAEAEALLAQWKDGEATEDSFAALVKEETDDTASAETGGLYENVNAGSNYVEPFLNWCLDTDRQVGDVEIVETEYGYHIMYFVGYSDMTYRDQMITDELRSADVEAWFTALCEANPVTEGNTKYLSKDMLLG